MKRLLLVLPCALMTWPALVGAQTPRPGLSLIISEVVANAGGGRQDAGLEWAELLNRGEEAVQLDGWSLEDGRDVDTLGAAVVPAGGYVVIVATQGAAPEAPRALRLAVEDGRIGNGLANTGDRLVLRNPAGAVADTISWGDDVFFAQLPKAKAGESFARPTPDTRFEVSRPTPGAPSPAATTAYPPLRISEILADAGQGAQDAAHEWLEIFNPTDQAVDLEGWAAGDYLGSDPITGRVPPGGRFIVAGSAAAVPDLPEAARFLVEDGRIGNGLGNGGDVAMLYDPAGREMDRVDFRAPPLPAPRPGISLARLDDGWVLNAEPTPGEDGVTPLLRTLLEKPQPAADDASDATSGVSAWLVVGVGLGVPAAALALVRWRPQLRMMGRRALAGLRR